MFNKEMIEQLEASVGGLKDNSSRMELGVADKLHQMEDTLKRLTDTLLTNYEGSSSNTPTRPGLTWPLRDDGTKRHDGGHQPFVSKLAKLEFPIFADDDPIEWLSHVEQFFDYQGIPDK